MFTKYATADLTAVVRSILRRDRRDGCHTAVERAARFPRRAAVLAAVRAELRPRAEADWAAELAAAPEFVPSWTR